jgi:2,3-dihydroxybenzoate-AMP ligase
MTDRAAHADPTAYPEDFAQRYRMAGLWSDRTIAQQFRATADAMPDRLALIGPSGSLTFAELDEQTDRIAVGLRATGLRPGERVLLQVNNDLPAVLAWYGLLKAGLVPVATLVQHRTHELTAVASLCSPAAHLVDTGYAAHDLVALAGEIASGQPGLRVLLTTGSAPGHAALPDLARTPGEPAALRAQVDRWQREISPDAVAALQLSGGTTSTPKLIPRRHAEYWYNSRAYAAAMELDRTGCVAHILPIVHNAGIVCALHAAHSVGAALALVPHDADQLLEVARRVPITHMLMSPPMASAVLRRPELSEALASMVALTWVLGAMPPALLDVFETDTCRVTQMFGMAEGLCMYTPRSAPLDLRLRSVGTPISGLDELRVYAPGTEDLVRLGQPGELCCRGPYTIRGYYRAPERNAEVFTADGYYRTGDIVVELGDGYYALADRIKDLINRGGEKVNAAEVEELLTRHPAIDRAAVVAMPDAALGERCCAFIVLAEGADPVDVDTLRAHLAALGVAKFKYPERVEIRDALPMTSVTKLNKAALRAEIGRILAAGQGRDPGPRD